jgi:phage-related protein
VDDLDPKRYNRDGDNLRELLWIGSSKRDLLQMPEDVQSEVGYALYLAQLGSKHVSTKPLKGFGSAGVLEVVEDFDGETYRAVYTVRFLKAVYVLHCFQKKSTHGIATSKSDMELIQKRLKAAELHSRGI